MKCSEVNEMMMRYFDGETNDIDYYYFKQHLKNCPACSERYAILSEVIGFMEEQPLLEPPADFEDCVMKSIKGLPVSKKNFLRVPVGFIYSFIGIAFLMLTIVTALFLHSFSTVDLIRMILNDGLSVDILNSMLLTAENSYRAVTVLCNLIFDIYCILFKNYYDVVFSMAAVLVIGYAMSKWTLRQH